MRKPIDSPSIAPARISLWTSRPRTPRGSAGNIKAAGVFADRGPDADRLVGIVLKKHAYIAGTTPRQRSGEGARGTTTSSPRSRSEKIEA